MNYQEHLWKQAEVIKIDDYVYIGVKRKYTNKTRHKLTPVADGPYVVKKTVKNTDDKTVVIENTDRSVENVWPSSVVLTPKTNSKEERAEIHKSMKVKNEHTKYPTKEDINSKFIVDRDDQEDEMYYSDH